LRKGGKSTLAKNFPARLLAQAGAALTRLGSSFEIDERDIRGVRTRIWNSAPSTIREPFLLGRAHGERTFAVFLVYRDERANYEV
jgi:long-chain acyl-CoA synthetase